MFLPIQKREMKKAGFLHQKKWFFYSKNHFFSELFSESAKTFSENKKLYSQKAFIHAEHRNVKCLKQKETAKYLPKKKYFHNFADYIRKSGCA